MTENRITNTNLALKSIWNGDQTKTQEIDFLYLFVILQVLLSCEILWKKTE